MFRTLKKKKNGFTLLEVIISAIIFTITAAGLLTAISMTRRPAQESTAKVQAIFHLKELMDSLASQVSANTWNLASSNLAVGTYDYTSGVYNITYEVSLADPSDPNGPRIITANISYPD